MTLGSVTIRMAPVEDACALEGNYRSDAQRGQDVTWYADVGKITLIFLDLGLFGQDTLTIEAGGSKTLTVRSDAAVGSHRYDIYCHMTESLAKNGVEPEIWITG